jgi:hypothetical protein
MNKARATTGRPAPSHRDLKIMARYHAWKPAEPTPTHDEAVQAGAFGGTVDQWHQLSPGMRREIVRTHRKTSR